MRRPPRISRQLPQHERKPQPWLRDHGHLEWVGTLPCLACGRGGVSVAAHVRLYNDGAAGRKPSDNKVVPLCGFPKVLDGSGCHDKQHGPNMSEAMFWAQLMEMGISDPWGVAERLYRVSRDIEQGFRTLQHARPGLPTASIGSMEHLAAGKP